MKNQIKYVKGNAVSALLEGKIDYLLHQCNCHGVMGSGIAKEIRERIPEAYEKYILHCESIEEEHRLGSFCVGGNVINMLSQQNFGKDGSRFTHYGAMAHVMNQLKKYFNILNKLDDTKQTKDIIIGLPKYIGCGLGGGDWEAVEELIDFLLVPYFKEVVIYEL